MSFLSSESSFSCFIKLDVLIYFTTNTDRITERERDGNTNAKVPEDACEMCTCIAAC